MKRRNSLICEVGGVLTSLIYQKILGTNTQGLGGMNKQMSTRTDKVRCRGGTPPKSIRVIITSLVLHFYGDIERL